VLLKDVNLFDAYALGPEASSQQLLEQMLKQDALLI
jgi:hypothetical protein